MSSIALKLKIPPNREFLGGDLLAQSLAALGVTVAFGLHGGHLDAFLMGCSDADIKLVDTRHETVAVQAAEGYAKVSGKVGVCFVTANSGFCNGLPGLATAFADRSPVFCVTSSPPLRDAETNCLQGFHDQVVLAKPVTKFAHRVTNVEEIPRLVAQAWRTAISGAPGPVLLDCPIDVLFSPPIQERIAWGSINRPLPYTPAPDPAGVAEALKLWTKAKRPAIITGTGARGTDFDVDLVKLAERTQTPVFYSSKFSNAVPHDHSLRGGPATRLASLPSIGAERPDFLLLLGARTGFLLGGRSGAVLPNEDCKFVQVDVDGSEIGKSHAIDIGIVSTTSHAVRAFMDRLDHEKSQPQSNDTRDGWIQTINKVKTLRSPVEDESYDVSPGRPHPYHAIKALFQSLEPGAIVCIDGGEVGGWALQLVELARPSLVMVTTGYLGFLGNGWGYTLGAAVASSPSQQVVNMHGDGSAGFHLAELDTFARHGLGNVLTVVSNNHAWGMSQAGQELIYGNDNPERPVSRLSPAAEYETVARGLQCISARVDRVEDVAGAVKKLVQQDNEENGDGGKSNKKKKKRPALLNLIVSDRPIHPATRAMVSVTESKDWIVVPYYDNIPRPYYKT